MKKFQPTLEHALYAMALLLGLGLRFLQLGRQPLSDYEAGWALQALHLVQGLKPVVGPNPAYVHLTAILFYIFGGTNFLARFWPALAGTVLVLAPGLLRGRIGRAPALALAFGLALDPGLVTMSHLAGGPMLAITCLVLAGLMWINHHRSLAGLLAGLAILSGTSVWFGSLGLLLTWAFFRVLNKKPSFKPEEQVEGEGQPSAPNHIRWSDLRGAMVWMLGTVLVLGSLFLLSPMGLPAVLVSFGDSLRGWWMLSDTPAWRPLLALPAYEILPLGFGIAGAVRGILQKDRDSRLLSIWAALGLILALIYPGKQTSDLVWALLPLWTLTALELGHHLDFEGHDLREVAGLAVLILVLLVFGWLNLAGMIRIDLTSETTHVRVLLLLAVAMLIGLSILLAGTGWSAAVARLGGVWAAVLALTLFTVAMSTGASGIREPLTVDLWQPEPRAGQLDMLLNVANQISDLNTGYVNQLSLTVQGVDSNALLWTFRTWQVQQVSTLAPDATPEMVITTANQVSLAANYRGEPLPLRELADWEHASRSDWLNWFVYRQMPMLREDIILWVRSDLMLDSQGLPSPPVSP